MLNPTGGKRTWLLGGPLQRAERASSKRAVAGRFAIWFAIWFAMSFAMSFGRGSEICENDEIMQIPRV